MDEIVLSEDLVRIINRCLKAIELGNAGDVSISYGIKIKNKEKFLLNPDIRDGGLLERLYQDIVINPADIEQYKNEVNENPDEDIFEFMYELRLSINGFEIAECNDDILVITPNDNSIASLIELNEFMKHLKMNNRIESNVTIKPVCWEH